MRLARLATSDIHNTSETYNRRARPISLSDICCRWARLTKKNTASDTNDRLARPAARWARLLDQRPETTAWMDTAATVTNTQRFRNQGEVNRKQRRTRSSTYRLEKKKKHPPKLPDSGNFLLTEEGDENFERRKKREVLRCHPPPLFFSFLIWYKSQSPRPLFKTKQIPNFTMLTIPLNKNSLTAKLDIKKKKFSPNNNKQKSNKRMN